MHAGLVRMLVPVSLLVVASGVSDREVASGSAVHQRAALHRAVRVVIQGTVTDLSTSLAVAEAQVTIVGTQIGARTGQDGRYRFVVPDTVASGANVTLRAIRIGYGASSKVIHLGADTTVTADFALSQAQLQLQAVVVTAAAATVERKSMGNSVTSVSSEKVGAAAPVTVQPSSAPRGSVVDSWRVIADSAEG